MEDFNKLSIDTFLDQIADRTPTPGGGGVTGLAGALACALSHMVAAYSVGKKTEPRVHSAIEHLAARLQRADQLLRGLITQDALAYDDMTKAAKAAKHDPSAGPAYDDAVMSAAAIPMEMAALASNALSTMDELKDRASSYLLSDLAIAAILADVAALAARYTVRINAREIRDTATRDKFLANIDSIVEHCQHHRESVETFVRSSLQTGLDARR
jgi:formiminotetrahydrofolate cyclodeaminase